jgi:hypothetical protein
MQKEETLMKCDRCGEPIPPGEEMDHFGQTLCEERFMHALSLARACDPWAARSAQTLSKTDEGYSGLSESQLSILRVLQETGGTETAFIAERL